MSFLSSLVSKRKEKLLESPKVESQDTRFGMAINLATTLAEETAKSYKGSFNTIGAGMKDGFQTHMIEISLPILDAQVTLEVLNRPTLKDTAFLYSVEVEDLPIKRSLYLGEEFVKLVTGLNNDLRKMYAEKLEQDKGDTFSQPKM
jgi:hypothetical protein